MWVEKTPIGNYKFCERYLDPLTGKQKKISVTLDRNNAQTRKIAQQTLAQKIAAALEEKKTDNYTLEDLVKAYIAYQDKTVKKSTCSRNKFACSTLMKILGKDILVDKITASYVKNKLLATGKQKSTLNEYIVRFKALIRWGSHNNMVSDARFLDDIQRFKDRTRKIKLEDKFLEKSELIKLIDSMENHPVWQSVTMFMALSGLRIGELVALTPADVDFENHVIHVTKTYDSINRVVTDPKTECSVRDVYIQPELEECLHTINSLMLQRKLKYRIRKRKLFLFDETGGYIQYFAYNKYLRQKSSDVLHHPITSHALRHTHASLMFEQGIDIEIISRRLGHENSGITRQIYLHITENLKEKDKEIIGQVKII